MNRYSFISNYDRNKTPQALAKMEALRDLYEELSLIGEDDHFLLGWQERRKHILKMFSDYWTKFGMKYTELKQAEAEAMIERAIDYPQSRKKCLEWMKKVIDE